MSSKDNMDTSYEIKAGPSGSTGKRTQKPQTQRRVVWPVAAVVLVFIFVYSYSVGFLPDQNQLWGWKFQSGDAQGEQYESSQGSRYLLGVGKGDITG